MSHNSTKFLENSKNKQILRIKMLVNTGPGLGFPRIWAYENWPYCLGLILNQTFLKLPVLSPQQTTFLKACVGCQYCDWLDISVSC